MRKYYTRPCNFYYGNYAKKLINKKKDFSLASNPNIAFDQVEVFQRKKKGISQSNVYPIASIKALPKKIKSVIITDFISLFKVFISAIEYILLRVIPFFFSLKNLYLIKGYI